VAVPLLKIYLMICFQIRLPSHLRECVRFESHFLSSLCIGDNNFVPNYTLLQYR
jgi:hypothetical protein